MSLSLHMSFASGLMFFYIVTRYPPSHLLSFKMIFEVFPFVCFTISDTDKFGGVFIFSFTPFSSIFPLIISICISLHISFINSFNSVSISLFIISPTDSFSNDHRLILYTILIKSLLNHAKTAPFYATI